MPWSLNHQVGVGADAILAGMFLSHLDCLDCQTGSSPSCQCPTWIYYLSRYNKTRGGNLHFEIDLNPHKSTILQNWPIFTRMHQSPIAIANFRFIDGDARDINISSKTIVKPKGVRKWWHLIEICTTVRLSNNVMIRVTLCWAWWRKATFPTKSLP